MHVLHCGSMYNSKIIHQSILFLIICFATCVYKCVTYYVKYYGRIVSFGNRTIHIRKKTKFFFFIRIGLRFCIKYIEFTNNGQINNFILFYVRLRTYSIFFHVYICIFLSYDPNRRFINRNYRIR